MFIACRDMVEKKCVVICNNVPCHNEVIESIESILIPMLDISATAIMLQLKHMNKSFLDYISKYKKHIRVVDYSTAAPPNALVIHATAYEKDIETIKSNPHEIFIAHRVSKELEELPNVWFLTPLAKQRWFIPRALPKIESAPTTRSEYPVIAIQGNIVESRRNFRALCGLLEKTGHLGYKIKLIGRGKLPEYLTPWADHFILELDRPYLEYHAAFAGVDALLALIDESFSHGYFTNQLTSTVSYAVGYNIPLIAHSRLARIYADVPDLTLISYTTPSEFINCVASFIEQALIS